MTLCPLPPSVFQKLTSNSIRRGHARNGYVPLRGHEQLSLPPPLPQNHDEYLDLDESPRHSALQSGIGSLARAAANLTSQAAATSAALISPSLVAVPDFPPVTRRRRKTSLMTRTCPLSRARMTRSTPARRRRPPKRSRWDEFDPVHGAVIPVGLRRKPTAPARSGHRYRVFEWETRHLEWSPEGVTVRITSVGKRLWRYLCSVYLERN